MTTPTPPVAERRPTTRSLHGDVVTDDYAWMADRDDPAVIAHLEAENRWTEATMAPLAPFVDRLYDELKARVQEDDSSVPVPIGPWEYYTRTVEGQSYPLTCRRPRGGGDETVLLDQNELSEGHDYLEVGDVTVSPDHRLLAYTVDTNGSERYELRIRDLATGTDLPDRVDLVYYGLAWANDNETILYTSPDEAMRPWQVWRHHIGRESHLDQLVYEEPDERFFVSLWRSRDDRWLVVNVDSKTTSEVHLIDADEPDRSPTCIQERVEGLEYGVDTLGDRLFVITNDQAVDFRVVETTVDQPGRDHWRELVAAEDRTRWEDVDALQGHLVVHGRRRARPVVMIIDLADGSRRELDFEGEVIDVDPSSNAEIDTTLYRVEVESPVQPRTWIDIDLVTDERTVLRQTPAIGVDLSAYRTRREWAVAPDGTEVPVSMVHRADTPLDGTAPLIINAYGAYEIKYPVTFNHARINLLDRGVVVAIAHVRGGGELGRTWWEQGRLAAKANTFSDTCAVADHLVAAGLIDPARIALTGGSAGGLLVGASIQSRPELFRAALAAVPFVDVVNTMLDETLPLTVTEWDEWGNPNIEADYRTIRSYAPYENVRSDVEYPAMLVTAGLNDPRVGYWEPAKWVARLRTVWDSDRPLLLKTELGAGHGGPSGRYASWRETVTEQAFLLTQLGINS